MKKILILLTITISIFLMGTIDTFAAQNVPTSNNVDIGQTSNSNSNNNPFLNDLGNNGDGDIRVGNEGEKSIVRFLYNIANDMKTIFYILSGVYFLIITIKLIASSNTEEEVSKFKKGIIWITIGIILMQIVFYFVEILYAQEIGADLAGRLAKNIVEPIIKVLETAASFFFLLIAIYSFYKIITANGDEEKIKTGKMAVVYGLIGFIIIKLSKDLVYASYGKINCNEHSFFSIFSVGGTNCSTENQISGLNSIIIQVLNWANGFVGILVILMIIYAGVQVLFSGGDEDKLSKAKKSIIYIIIGIGILVLNYFILTFLIRPEVSITI